MNNLHFITVKSVVFWWRIGNMTENPAFFPCEPHDIWWEAGCDSPNVVFSENGFLFIREALIYRFKTAFWIYKILI